LGQSEVDRHSNPRSASRTAGSIAQVNANPVTRQESTRRRPADIHEQNKADLEYRRRLQLAGQKLSKRPVVLFSGPAELPIAAYNKVDPRNPNTVYQNFKGPFNSNTAQPEGEELLLKFSAAVQITERAELQRLKLIGLSDRLYFKNNTGDEAFPFATFPLAGLQRTIGVTIFSEPIWRTFDPTLVTYNNQPKLPAWLVGTPMVFSLRAGDSTGGSFGIAAGAEIYGGTQTEWDTPAVPDPTIRSGYLSLISSISGGAINVTPTTFQLSAIGALTDDFTRDDFCNGWVVDVVSAVDTSITGKRFKVTDYDGATQTFTYGGLPGFASGTSIILYPKIYGVRLRLYTEAFYYAGIVANWQGLDSGAVLR
jgi:hypothetical protein